MSTYTMFSGHCFDEFTNFCLHRFFKKCICNSLPFTSCINVPGVLMFKLPHNSTSGNATGTSCLQIHDKMAFHQRSLFSLKRYWCCFTWRQCYIACPGKLECSLLDLISSNFDNFDQWITTVCSVTVNVSLCTGMKGNPVHGDIPMFSKCNQVYIHIVKCSTTPFLTLVHMFTKCVRKVHWLESI